METSTFQKLLISTSRDNHPVVIVPNAVPNITDKQQTPNLKREISAQGICKLCGKTGQCIETVQDLEILVKHLKFGNSQAFRSTCFCLSCDSFLSRAGELHKTNSKIENKLSDITSAIHTVLRIRGGNLVQLGKEKEHTDLPKSPKQGAICGNVEFQASPNAGTEDLLTYEIESEQGPWPSLDLQPCPNPFSAPKPKLWRLNRGKVFSCYFCDKLLSSFSCLTPHMQQHTKEFVFHKCEQCSKTFQHRPHLWRHIYRGCEKQAALVRCYFCSKQCREGLLLTNHLSRHTGEFIPYKCDVCSKTFLKRESFLSHRIVKCGKDEIKREILIEKSRRKAKEARERYFEKAKKENIKCYFCQKSMCDRNRLKEHISVHTKENARHKCEKCGKFLSSVTSFRRHKISMCGESPKKVPLTIKLKQIKREGIQCYFCNSKFTNELNLECHTRRHTLEGMPHCPKCKRFFSKNSRLQYHLVSVCGNDREKALEFRKNRTLLDNKRKGNSVRNHLCNKCGKQYTLKGLQAHSTNCGEEMARTKLCPKCGLLFPTKEDRVKHQISAHGGRQRKGKCYFCGKIMNKSDTLRDHILGHTNEKIFKCEKCESRFSYRYQLYWHRVHICKNITDSELTKHPKGTGTRIFKRKKNC